MFVCLFFAAVCRVNAYVKQGMDIEPLSNVKTTAEHSHCPPIDGWEDIKSEPSII